MLYTHKLRKKVSGLVASVALMSVAPVFADEIPEILPNLASIQAYQKYLESGDHRAFAIAKDGAFAFVISQQDEQAAVNNATSACNQLSYSYTCSVISTNGETEAPLIDVKYLKGKFRDAMGRIWPKADESLIPVQASEFPDAIDGFRQYLQMRGMKAFAIASDGAFGVSAKHTDIAHAVSQALQACQQETKYADSCTVVTINQEIQGPSTHLN